jgi:hypothetical protein
MNPTRRRVATLAVALGALVIAPSAASADDATTAAVALVGWGGTPAAFLDGTVVGQMAAVIGPVVITTAPSTFINSNTQISAGLATSGVQASAGVTGTG